MQGNVKQKLRISMLFVALGVVYGDIGTSPLYVMNAIVATNGGMAAMTEEYILGCLSLVIWTLTMLTTVKYVLICMQADNHGEGGIFSLYTLVRKQKKWLVIPAMIGGAALLADGILTPAVTVSAAIEGLAEIPYFYNAFASNQKNVIMIVIVIITAIFFFQRFGTGSIGKVFGPLMFIWFTMIGLFGLMQLVTDLSILRAFNPLYGINILFSPDNKMGLLILGTVFLCATGAEALYSDMGHVGKKSIYVTWPFVKVMLILSYLGQGAWTINHMKDDFHGETINPFFQIMPESFILIGVIMATIAAIIASQALITGAFTLVSEAIHLRFMPKLDIKYPSTIKGQMYIPVVTGVIWFLCILVVLYFKTSVNMEAAYGLSITVTMMMTTVLLCNYLIMKHVNKLLIFMMTLFFMLLEMAFFFSSLAKFMHGGYVAVLISGLLIFVMIIWYNGYLIKDRQSYDVHIERYLGQLKSLSADRKVPKFATNLVYLTTNEDMNMIEKQVIKSILDGRPKRADVYWFVNVLVSDEPFQVNYRIEKFGTDNIFKVQLILGFRMHQNVNYYVKTIARSLIQSKEMKEQFRAYGTNNLKVISDFQFIILKDEVPLDANIAWYQKLILQWKLELKRYTASPVKWFELPSNEVIYETIPLTVPLEKSHPIKRI
ncbi:KUP/HAK/KT family potassium transporter [Macrococcoides canis]|uniref:KUP/HAK/KT family potassium transporter n=1 Tax=Macrococcoides canis TaxID=1855823 RepID=UPI001F1F152D|nr:KUP/HAK/KT family potassium transporter [Macrococcus canis]UJS28770.1 KUP/HAK/KT family potassium transporter [Macrococcus canis]UTH12484.1 KUP/HAK/KT family potassium transporter [Macrococcus canis]